MKTGNKLGLSRQIHAARPAFIQHAGSHLVILHEYRLNHIMTKNLSGPGTIYAVVNGVGDTVDGIPDPGDSDNCEDPGYVIGYPELLCPRLTSQQST